jgi:hypothetical protein
LQRCRYIRQHNVTSHAIKHRAEFDDARDKTTTRKRGHIVLRGIGSFTSSPYADHERQTSLRFDVLAGSLLKAGPTERAKTLEEVSEKNPGLANRLRQFLDRSQEQQESFVQHLESLSPTDRDKAVGWPNAGWNRWKEELCDLQETMTEQAKVPQVDLQQAIGLTGQPRTSIVFTPEEVPVMGTEPTAPGMMTAFAAGGIMPGAASGGSPLHVMSGLLSRKTLQMTSALDAYGRTLSS